MISPDKFSLSATRSVIVSRGFTLVELLVVIVIIAALSAAGFTAATSARAQAIAATDSAKLRQVGTALVSLAQDNRGIIPHGATSNGVPLPGYGIPGTGMADGEGNLFEFHEAIDRYVPPAFPFDPTRIDNYTRREGGDSIFTSRAVKPYPGFTPMGRLPGPLWFSFNVNLNDENWAGRLNVIPDPSKLVIVAETNHAGGEMRPSDKAEFADNVSTRHRVSRPGKTALYLFVDGHLERLTGDRGEAYYATNANAVNIWKWW